MADEKRLTKFARGLRGTISLITFLMLIAIVLIVGTTIVWRMRVVIKGQLTQYGISMARNLARNVWYPLISRNTGELDKLVEGISQEKDVVYVLIYDEDGDAISMNPFAHENSSELNRRANIGLIKSEIDSIIAYTSEIEIENRKYLDIFVKVTSTEEEEVEKSVSAEDEFIFFDMGEPETETGKAGNIGIVRIGISTEEMGHATMDGIVIVLILILVSAIIGILLLSYLINKIVDPIIHISRAMTYVKDGDLATRVRFQSKNEIGVLAQNFNEMLAEFESIISHVLGTSNDVASTSEELSAATEEITASTQEVSSSVEQIAEGAANQSEKLTYVMSASERISSSARKMANNASETEKVVSDIAKSATNVRQSSQEILKSMISIAEVTSETVRIVNELGEKSNQISKIIEKVADISQQTNLLSLNAGIEAARAGEHGKGFQVLARSIRSLADETKQYSFEITKLIKEIQASTELSVKGINNVAHEVQIGEQKIEASSNVLIQIADDVQSSTSNVRDISEAALQQQKEMEQLVKEIETIASIAENNAANSETVSAVVEEQNASMEEMSSSSQLLATKAEELIELVRRFKVSV